jgi:hypothetical protein
LKEPGVGTYNISPRQQIKGGKPNKCDRITFIEEAMTLSKVKPGYVTKNYKHTEEKAFSYVFPKPGPKMNPTKDKNTVIVGPSTYNIGDAYKNS